MAMINLVVDETTLAMMTSSVAKITFVVADVIFKVPVNNSSVAEITFVVD